MKTIKLSVEETQDYKNDDGFRATAKKGFAMRAIRLGEDVELCDVDGFVLERFYAETP